MATYLAITKDDEVSIKEDVKVEETDLIEKKRILSLGFIDDQLTQVDDEIARLQIKKAELEVLRALIDAEAVKIALKI